MKFAGKMCCVLLLAFAAAGCSKWQVLTSLGMGAAAAGGAATMYYIQGDLEADQDGDIDRVYQASLSAMKTRGYTVTENEISDTSGRIDAVIPATGGDNERDVTIKLDRTEEANLTHLSIRVGVFGDETLSRAIFEDIQSNLK